MITRSRRKLVAATALLTLGTGLGIAHNAAAATPKFVVDFDNNGKVSRALSGDGSDPIVVQTTRPANPGTEVQIFYNPYLRIVVHAPTAIGVPEHRAPAEGEVHGCHQWVLIGGTWYLVHC